MDDCHTFQIKSADGTKLFARRWDASADTAERPGTLLIVHGFGEHSGRYSDFGQQMAGYGADVFAVDLRGHGRSDGKRGVVRDYDDFRADLAALIDHVRSRDPARPVVLFGHSMGGGIVLDHALSPDPLLSGIVASAPLIRPVDEVKGAVRGLAKLIGRIMPGGSLRNAISGPQISSVPAEQLAYTQDPHNHDRLGFRTAVAIIERGEALDAMANTGPLALPLPLLMLHGRDDQLCQFEASERFARAAKADFRAFAKVQHELHNDTTRGTVYRAVSEFMERVA